ncbi:acyl-CoA dehydrogenase family protein [Rhodovulum sulfidophilum]|uniref:acyl-CoA dehydrogenase family protein n=1 Tax=Rhodovulum sulfidophilum TaxID=35806 RepID=UPI001922665C|nr:acyl-CoA dehydrogenase family protein [Rhodovulum sulfidophilum]MBL3574054.1 acyl-CoA dehydrogenase family protein [Rhodovulum sulfidophilum]MCE8431004.1 acyl-CoA dehydrogenase family protein [Rhodovulum sulfidophilum]MCF4116098.1 acyl-CoA dehydrogenase family protein [Rhodovulum sulfidophilum]
MREFDHLLSAEECQFLDMLDRFAAEVLTPQAAETDRTGAFVHDQLAALAETGMMGANLPERWGGADISAHALFEAVAAIAGGCGSTVSALTAHFLATDSLLLGGDDAIRARFLPAAAEGRMLGAFGLTEPNAGSDPADMRSRATRDGDSWHIKGRKCFISNGGVADFVVVFCVTDPEAGHRGISAFVVEKGTPGLVPGRVEQTMGLKGGHVWELDIDVTVPDANRVGPEGSGFKTAMKVLDNGRTEVAAMAVGIARAALSEARDWAKSRIIGGEPLANRQGIQWMLADMATELSAAELLGHEAARQRQAGLRFTTAASKAKLYASEAAGRIADTALQIHGGYGFTHDFPLERHARDLRIMRIYEGSSEIQRNIIAGRLLA